MTDSPQPRKGPLEHFPGEVEQPLPLGPWVIPQRPPETEHDQAGWASPPIDR